MDAFKGRARRKEYGLLTLKVFAIYFASGLIMSFLATTEFFWLVAIVFVLVCFYYSFFLIAAGVRRLHDLNRSGWWHLLCLIPYVALVFYVLLLCMPSHKEANQWGAMPD